MQKSPASTRIFDNAHVLMQEIFVYKRKPWNEIRTSLVTALPKNPLVL